MAKEESLPRTSGHLATILGADPILLGMSTLLHLFFCSENRFAFVKVETQQRLQAYTV